MSVGTLTTTAAATRLASRGSKRRPATDEDFGVIQDTLDWPAAKVAEVLGCSTKYVYDLRARARRGEASKINLWTRAEDELLTDLTRDRASWSELMGSLPGRSRSSIKYRRQELNLRPVRVGIGTRTLIAKTCPDCGRFRSSEWFTLHRGRRGSFCRECNVLRARRYPRNGAAESKRQYEAAAQELTLPHASKAGDEWTEADCAVLADHSLTDIEKALRLRRSFFAVQKKRVALGFQSSATRLSDLDLGEWSISSAVAP